ncbi:unnamed protein product [Urochloa decumbens]|uniref:Receptor kinase-like protein Xa21 n=1 Tax=Urochloa decumbens TaxID=240449 RepID=A0ABC9AYM5_9POAL
MFHSSRPYATTLPAYAAAGNESSTDRGALLCLKSQLHDPSRVLSSWRDDSYLFCEWHGVTCSKQHASRVIALDLESENIGGNIFPCITELSYLVRIHMPNNQLSGHISPEVGQLSWLRYLNLSMNSLNGEIPKTISSCSHLETIDLYSNSLQGDIPPSLGQCSSLRTIILSNNNFQGSIPPELGLLPNLSALFFLSNKLTGHIPERLGSSRYLRWLNLQNNSLSGGIPPILFNSTSLSYIDLSYNWLSGSIPPFMQASSSPLQYLSLTENNLSGEIPHSLGNVPSALYNMSSLKFLGLGANNLVGRIPNNIGNTLSGIGGLVLEGNKFEGPIPDSLANASNLQYLDFRSNAFTGIIPLLGSLSMLTYIDVGENRLEAGDSSFMSSLSNCTQLTNLWLDRNNIQGLIELYTTNIPKSLEVLVAIDNQLSGTITSAIGNFTNLTALQLDNNLLSGLIPDTLGNLPNLSVLSLSKNELSGEIPQSIGNLEQLTNLYFEENYLTGLIPSSLHGCEHLTKLNLSSNNLYGQIPPELFSIYTLSEGLDLSYNQLTGDIPPEIGRLINLNSLSLSNNKLSGEIPSTLGECVLLDSLHLEENFLRGSIPNSFISLQGIVEMDLSRNNLSGGVFTNSSDVFIQVTLGCAAVIVLKKTSHAKQLTDQSVKQLKNFSYTDLFNATDGFSADSLVGSGRFGMVYRGQFKFELCPVAIKVFRLQQLGAPSNFLSECEALRNIRHRNLIKVISLCSTFDPTGNEFKALILEYMSNGNLESWLYPKKFGQTTKRSLGLSSRITIGVDIAAALDYLHNRCTPALVHCDLKPSNVLLDAEMVARLSDFGLAKFLTDGSAFINSSSIAGPRGSIGYIAPEYGTGCRVSVEGDIYSFGIILLEMITGKRPTHEMFKDSISLQSFVELSLPQKINEILEPSLIAYHEGKDIDQVAVGIQSCAMQLANLGLKCSKMSPKGRPTTEDVYAEIMAIKEEFSVLRNRVM